MISVIDIVLALLLGLSIWKGWKNGFVYEVVMFLALFAAVYIAINFSDWGAGVLTDKFEVRSEYLPVMAFGFVFLLVVVGAWFLAKLISGLANAGGAEWPNRVFGAFFALAKTVFVLSLAFVFLIGADIRYGWLTKEQREKSVLLEPIYKFSGFVLPAVEHSDFYQRLKEKRLVWDGEE